jgi:hypothetical protein
LLAKLRTYQGNRFETRAFVYLDIISWLESKIRNVPVQKIIREKFLLRNSARPSSGLYEPPGKDLPI